MPKIVLVISFVYIGKIHELLSRLDKKMDKSIMNHIALLYYFCTIFSLDYACLLNYNVN